jgi:hypothetical protein
VIVLMQRMFETPELPHRDLAMALRLGGGVLAAVAAAVLVSARGLVMARRSVSGRSASARRRS